MNYLISKSACVSVAGVTQRSYGQFCAAAKALDVVGERWTLLVVRELLLGPRRFTDLLAALPGLGTSLLASRLKQLEAAGVIRREQLPPPAGSWVYQITDAGLGVALGVKALADWGAGLLDTPGPEEAGRADWLALHMAASAAAGPGAGGRRAGTQGQPFTSGRQAMNRALRPDRKLATSSSPGDAHGGRAGPMNRSTRTW